MRTMRLTVVCFAAAMIAGCGTTPNRENTAAALKRHPEVFSPVVWFVEEARYCVAENPIFSNDKTREVPQAASALMAAGLMSIHRLGSNASDRACMAFYGAYYHEARLTEKGRQASRQWARDGSMYRITVAEPQALKVDGITPDQNSVRVEYSVDYAPTEIGKLVGYRPRQATATAVFRKYDDGWRLVESGAEQLQVARR